jgi:hypothetical protein
VGSRNLKNDEAMWRALGRSATRKRVHTYIHTYIGKEEFCAFIETIDFDDLKV